MLIFIMASTTQTLSQIKSQEFIGHVQKHLITIRPLTYVTNGIQDFVKCCIKSWVPLDLRPDIMQFGGHLQIAFKLGGGGGGGRGE